MRSRFVALGLAAVLLAATAGGALALSVTADLDGVHIDRRAREVVAIGTITCDAGATGVLRAALEQGDRSADGETQVVCTGSQTTWEVRMPLGSLPFRPGEGILDWGWFITDGVDGVASGGPEIVDVEPR